MYIYTGAREELSCYTKEDASLPLSLSAPVCAYHVWACAREWAEGGRRCVQAHFVRKDCREESVVACRGEQMTGRHE